MPELPLPGTGRVAIAVPAPGAGPGRWAGASAALGAGGGIVIGLPRPLGRSAGRRHGSRARNRRRAPHHVGDAGARFSAESLERPALLRTETGRWRLYVCCATPGSKHWWIDALEAADPAGFADEELANGGIEGSFQHILADLFAFIATAIAGAIILATGFAGADGIAALIVAALMVRASYGLLRDSGRVLLEAAPQGVSVTHVESIHDLHVWEVGSGFAALSAHVLVHPGDDCHAIRRELEQLLWKRFGIDHTTLQDDHRAKERLLTMSGSEA